MSAPAAHDLLEYHFNKVLEKLDEKSKRDYEFRGEVADAFVQMRKILRGKNTNESFTQIRQDESGKVDTSGWGIENDLFMQYAAKVDRAMAVKYQIYPTLIMALDKVGQTGAVSQKVAENNARPQETFIAEKPGLIDGFRGWVSSLRPQWKQDREKGISMLSTLFEDPHNTVLRWEAYKTQHWKNVMKAITFEPEQFWPVMVLELHALSDVEMRVLRMVDAAIEMRVTEQSKSFAAIAGQIIQSKTIQAQQPMMPGPMAQVPSNGSTR